MHKNLILNGLIIGLASFLIACSEDVDHQSASLEQSTATIESSDDTRPNILLIVADDLGYTDLGVYGSEIETPNLDQLAKGGVMLTDFHTEAVCAPTRASILSGTDSRNAGGAMHQAPNQIGVPGYESNLSRDVVAFPDLLQQAGYKTYWVGKWHLGHDEGLTPDARGFDRSFALMEGFASHYSDATRGTPDQIATYVEDGEDVESLPDDFYSSNFYTDYLIDAIESDSETGQPWFAFLGYTAPHWPLQAPDEYIDKYAGYYDEGYDVLREQRVARGKELGVIPSEAQAYPRLQRVPAWDELSEDDKKIASREMELYAAMVDGLDQNVGRLLDYLRSTDQFENTFIVFISDNGAEGEDRDFGGDMSVWDNSLENMGRVHSYIYYGAKWAAASVGVGREYKSRSTQGGTLAPAFFHFPELSKVGEIRDEFVTVVDLAPTFLELAGADGIQKSANGQPLQELQGYSLVPFLMGEDTQVRPDDAAFGWEVFGHRAIRKGDWKLLWLTSQPSERIQPLAEGADHWGLYNVAVDPGEVNDVSLENPEKVAELLEEWGQYVEKNGIVLPVREN